MKVYLVRHGETEWNRRGKIQGQADIPLNEKGEDLAFLTGQKMKDIPFKRIYTSPLSRARRTAELISGQRGLPLMEDSRLLEISYGNREGQLPGVSGAGAKTSGGTDGPCAGLRTRRSDTGNGVHHRWDCPGWTANAFEEDKARRAMGGKVPPGRRA